MKAVTKRDDIVKNITTFEGYLSSKDKKDKEFAVEAIRNAPTLLVYKVNGDNHFAPAGFVAYKGLKIEDFKQVDEEDREISNIMTKIVGLPFSNSTTEEKFEEYLTKHTKSVPDKERQFWRIKDERRKNLDLSL